MHGYDQEKVNVNEVRSVISIYDILSLIILTVLFEVATIWDGKVIHILTVGCVGFILNFSLTCDLQIVGLKNSYLV